MTRVVTESGHRVAAEGRYNLLAAHAPDLPPEGYRLRFVPSGGGGTVVLAAADRRGLIYGCQTAAELIGTEPRGGIALSDGPSFAWRGVVEGFYGRPWHHKERLEMLDFMEKWRLNAYMYAPKDDPYHRRLWRAPYGRKALDRFASLAETARGHGVDFGVAVSPGLSLRYGDGDDYRLLLEKFRQFTRLGLILFGLYFDDIPGQLVHAVDRERFAGLASAQASLANRLFTDLAAETPGLHLIFCPTEYCGRGDSEYLRELGTALRPEIDVHWTGVMVCSTRITRPQAEQVGAILHRPPLYWDNYPVNDYWMATELHLAPYHGRDRDLASAARGVLANPMNQALASRFALASTALYLWRPESYVAEAAAAKVYQELLPEEARPAFAHFVLANAPEAFVSPRVPRAGLLRTRRLIAHGRHDDGRQAWVAQAYQLASSAALLARHLPGALRREIHPWLNEYAAWAELAARGCWIEEDVFRLQGAEKKAAKLWAYLRLEADLARLRRGLGRSVSWRTNVCGGSLREYLADKSQRIEGLIRAAPNFPLFLRPLFRLAGLALTRRRGCGPDLT
jgi:hyaluronoglucosaminidase